MPLYILKIGKMPKTLMKREKCITGSHAFVHFENGQNAKNDLKPTNAKKKPVCISEMGQGPKTLMKTRKCITGPHASVYFKNGPNAKNAHENEKNV